MHPLARRFPLPEAHAPGHVACTFLPCTTAHNGQPHALHLHDKQTQEANEVSDPLACLALYCGRVAHTTAYKDDETRNDVVVLLRRTTASVGRLRDGETQAQVTPMSGRIGHPLPFDPESLDRACSPWGWDVFHMLRVLGTHKYHIGVVGPGYYPTGPHQQLHLKGCLHKHRYPFYSFSTIPFNDPTGRS